MVGVEDLLFPSPLSVAYAVLHQFIVAPNHYLLLVGLEVLQLSEILVFEFCLGLPRTANLAALQCFPTLSHCFFSSLGTGLQGRGHEWFLFHEAAAFSGGAMVLGAARWFVGRL